MDAPLISTLCMAPQCPSVLDCTFKGVRKKYLKYKVSFDWEIRISDFGIECESENGFHLRDPSSGWISIKKSKSGFRGSPFYRSIGKRICKTILVNSGLLFADNACACETAVHKDSFSNPFSDFPIERQK